MGMAGTAVTATANTGDRTSALVALYDSTLELWAALVEAQVVATACLAFAERAAGGGGKV